MKNKKTEKVGNVMIYRFGIGSNMDKYVYALVGGFFARRLHRKLSFDGAWCMQANYAGFAAEQFSRLTGVPYTLSLQQGDPLEQVEARAKRFRKRFLNIFRHATVIQSISTYLEAWGKRCGFNGPSVVIPNGVDVGRFTQPYPPAELARLRSSFGFADGATVMVTASRLVTKNAVGDVIEAMRSLPEQVCFVICGEGDLGASLRKKVSEYGLEDRVRFMGTISHDDLPRILRASDIFIRPALSEGLGNAFLEAMAAEIITVGTPVGGIVDFLEDGVNGFMVEPGRPESIVQQIERIMQLTEAERQHITTAARRLVEDRFDWTRIATDMNHIFDEICASS